MRIKGYVQKSARVATLLVVTASMVIAAVPAGTAKAAVSNPAPTAKVTFTFDDALASTYTAAAPTLAAQGLVGVNYATTGCVGMTIVPNACPADGNAPYMTWQQLQDLQNVHKWEIGGHTVNHPQLATDKLTKAQIAAELNTSNQALKDHGINPTDFATPYGDYNPTVLAEVAKVYASHRGFHDVDNNVWSYNDYLLNNMQVQAGVTVAAVKARIDQAIANKHWLILTFHDIKATPSANPEDYQYATADLAQIAAYVKAKQDAAQIKAVTVNQGLVTSDTNLLPNPSFNSGLTEGWTTDDATRIKVDTGNNGSYPNPLNSVSLTAGTTNNHLFSPRVAVDNTKTYLIKNFLNITKRTAGELGYYVDEYDANDNWIGGQWLGAETVATVKGNSRTYKPSTPTVKKASLQVYTTANSGITAFVDSFQWFSLTDTTPVPPPSDTNLLPNSTFDGGISQGWTTNNATAFKADASNNGSPENPVNSVKMTAAATNTYLFAPQVAVDNTKTYNVKAYLNVTARTAGEVAFYIDEYNTAGDWISGQYAYAKRNTGIETVSFNYVPTSANVKKAGLQIILEGNSGIAGYVDNVRFLPPSTATPPTTPPPTTPPSNTVTVPNANFDNGLADGWITNDAVNIKADATSNGSPSNPVNSIVLNASTQTRHLFGPLVAVDATKAYTLTSYLKITQITGGEVAFYIDEYDVAGNWVSGQYKASKQTVSTGDVSFTYTPTTANVKKASLQVIVVANSGAKAYFDDLRWTSN